MSGNTSLNFLRLLELRLSTAVWRLGFAKTIFQARQMVNHCHVQVNGRVVNIPSFQLKVGDVVQVRDREASRGIARASHFEGAAIPAYMEPDVPNFSGKDRSPARARRLPQVLSRAAGRRVLRPLKQEKPGLASCQTGLFLIVRAYRSLPMVTLKIESNRK